MMKPLIGFDMDGVIIDSEDFSEANWIATAFMKTLAEFGIPKSEENARALYVKNMRENSAAFCQRFGINDPHLLWDRREAHYVTEKFAALEAGQIHLYQDVSALEELSCDYSLGLVSNSPQTVVDRVIAHFSLERLFRVWIGRGNEDPYRNGSRLLRRRPARRRRGRPRRIASSDPPHPQRDIRGYSHPYRIGRLPAATPSIEREEFSD
jgi:beta-phosphoglucomutase-like phosphatase (HAD superfamily)